MICTCLLKFPVYVTNILLFFTCTKIFLSSADVTSCDFDYLENHEVDLSAIADEGKAVILAEKTARDMNDCSELCCGIYEDSYANNKTCNTAIYLPTLERPENCFMMHCNDVYCGQEYLLDTDKEEESYVIFLKRFPDEESLPMTTTEPVILDFQETTKEDIQSEESIPILRTAEPSDENNDSDTFVDHEEANSDMNSDQLASSGTQEDSLKRPGSDFGAIILVTFVCLSIAAATVLVANKCYQNYEKRKLYDKLDYLSAEPLYSSSTYKD